MTLPWIAFGIISFAVCIVLWIRAFLDYHRTQKRLAVFVKIVTEDSSKGPGQDG